MMLNYQVIDGALSLVHQVFSEQKALDKAYAHHFTEHHCSLEEQAGVIQLTGSLVRRINLYEFLLETSRLSFSQRLDDLCTAWCLVEQQHLPDFINMSEVAKDKLNARWIKAQEDRLLLDGCPDWLERCGQEQLGERWPAERAALALPAKRYIRANLLKVSPLELQLALKRDGIETELVSGVPSALEVTSDSALFKSRAFRDGLFEQQDAGSQLIIEALDLKPGLRVIDACAGAGGKALGIAALMRGRGKVLAMDTEEYKLNTLKKRAKRADAANIETRLITSTKIIKRQKDSADRLLLDVPCSGLGVLRRHPEAKWLRNISEDLPTLMKLQAELLERYSKMLKMNGIMVYSTCSILPSENEQQVEKFLSEHPEFKLLEQMSVSPAATGYDGFYWAKCQRVS